MRLPTSRLSLGGDGRAGLRAAGDVLSLGVTRWKCWIPGCAAIGCIEAAEYAWMGKPDGIENMDRMAFTLGRN